MTTGTAQDTVVAGRSWIGFLAGFGVLYLTLGGLAELDGTGRFGLAILAAVLVVGLAVEWFLDRVPPREAPGRLGFGRPAVPAVVVAAGVAAVVQLAYPAAVAATGERFALRSGWLWLAVGIFAFHGLAEELVWRGYAYRRLRVGRSFGRACLWTMPLIAATHVPILIRSGVAVGVAALIVAAITTLPMARLFEAGRSTVWAPAVVHTGIDSFKLVEIPSDAQLTFSLLLAAFSVVVPLAVLVLPRRLLP